MRVRWAVNVSQWTPGSKEFNSYLQLLPKNVQNEVSFFRFFDDQKRALISRLLQRHLLHLCFDIKYKDIIISKSSQGRPYLDDLMLESNPGFDFNVSHHGDFVVLAAEPCSSVGVDITCPTSMGNRSVHEFLRSFTDYFTHREWETIWSVQPDESLVLDQFHRHWALKESYVKATGTGLNFNLKRIEFSYKDQHDPWSQEAVMRLDGCLKPEWSFFITAMEGSLRHWVSVAKGPPKNAPSKNERAAREGGNVPFEMLHVENLLPIVLEDGNA